MSQKDERGFFEALRGRLCVGWNRATDFADRVLLPYREYIGEVFLAAPTDWGVDHSDEHRDRHMDEGEVVARVAELARIKPGLDVNILLNTGCLGHATDPESCMRAVRFAGGLDGATSVTVSSLLMLDYMREYAPHLKVHLSVKMNLDSTLPIRAVLDRYGDGAIDTVNVGRRAVYDLVLLDWMGREFPRVRRKVILNEFCMASCPDADYHTQCNAHSSLFQGERLWCRRYTPKSWWHFFTGNGIYPRDVHQWFGKADLFKVSSRWLASDQIAFIIEEYLAGRATSLRDLLDVLAQGGTWFRLEDEVRGAIDDTKPYPGGFTDRRLACDRDCDGCRYCEEVARGFDRR